ncbi:hypothetical protein AB0N89_19650 [Amycolatopsis sp. NPDC089917]|uniref:hypothetical protein n=1 Tax=Amycolatopsis sp. NPDC089917 TaxID=3155187 RepID=UPI00342F1D23
MRARVCGAVVEVRWTDECGLPDHVLVAWAGRTPEAWLRRADLVVCSTAPDDAWRHAGDLLTALPGALVVIAGGLIRFRDHRRVPAPDPIRGATGPGITGWPRYPGGGSEEGSVSSAIAAIRVSTRRALRSLDLR